MQTFRSRHDVAPLQRALHTPSMAVALVSERLDRSSFRLEQPLPLALRWFALGLLGLTIFSVLVNVVCYTVLHLGFPFDTPFVAPASLFDDLVLYTPNSHLMHTSAYFQVHDLLIYPAPGHIVYWVLSLAGAHVVLAYLVSAAVIVVTALLLFARSLYRSHIGWEACSAFAAALLVTSFPLAFTLYTGNIELYVWLLVLCGIWAYCSGREGWAVACFALAGSAKLYPLIFFLLFARRGHWHRVVQGIGIGLASFAGSLWLIYPNILVGYREISVRTSAFVNSNILGYKAGLVGYDHAPWSLYKAMTSPWIEMHSKTALDVYLAIGLGVTAWLWFTRVRKMPRLEQIVFLSVAMLVLPPISNDYTLLHLYAPFGLLVLAIVREEVPPRLYVPWLICFAVLFAPESFVIAVSTHFAGQMKCLFLLAMFFTTALAGRMVWDGEGHPAALLDET